MSAPREERPPMIPATGPAGAPEISPNFVWMETNRRIDVLGHRLDRMDETGTRGVDALRVELAGIRRDFLDHEGKHSEDAREAATARRWLIGVVVALITPLYPLLIGALIWAVKHG